MTERQERPILGAYENREEYHFFDPAAQKTYNEQAFQSIQNLIDVEKSHHNPALEESYKDGVVVQKLSLMHTDAYSTVDVVVGMKTYREGHLLQLAKVSTSEFVYGSTAPFIARYVIEQCIGGSLISSVAQADIAKGSGLDEREMTPYDYKQFTKKMNSIAALSTHSLMGERSNRAGE